MNNSNKLEKFLSQARNFSISSKYIVLYFGHMVIILDKKWKYKAKIKHLRDVYYGYISKDETKLLLVSITNKITIVSLVDFSIRNLEVKKPYDGNLEGRGTWTNESNSFFVPIQNSHTMLSTVREYNVVGDICYEDFLTEKYWIVDIHTVEKKLFIIAFDRSICKWLFIWKCGNIIEHIILTDFNDAVLGVSIDEKQSLVALTGAKNCYIYDFCGSRCSYDVITEIHLSPVENITNIFFSINENVIYVLTTQGMYILNLTTNSVAKHIKVEFGVQKVYELSLGKFMYSTRSGIKFDEYK